ncbi:unnamed protein product [Symbiodinium natans]|uniref:Methyltransferase FkbM domain-containing protein n=1 Tax=Symbiodinium natans TaxID=878477 RepID=A0A812NLF0_9DINO|nr:unnamed protein product [Symbiodinium natans]
MLKPLPAEVWYDGAGFERARLRYRFGKARRSHCAVPNWRLLREEPLRLYALISARSQVLPRILINVGAGDAQADDPLGLVLTEFARAGRPWTGVYFEAIPENCAKASSKLAETGAIHLECAYATPDTVVEAICQELGRQEVPGIDAVCQAAGVHIQSTSSSPDFAVPAGARVEVDAMSLDIDSYDCSVLREALRIVSPKFVSVEISAFPPPVVVSAEFHPIFQAKEKKNMSSEHAIRGGTKRDGFNGCSFSAAISMLWPHGLGLYRMAARDALFVRGDVAEEIGLSGKQGEPWQPADEFDCWRNVCADVALQENLINLTSVGVYGHLLPRIYEILQSKYGQQGRPTTVTVATPPPWPELPQVPLVRSRDAIRKSFGAEPTSFYQIFCLCSPSALRLPPQLARQTLGAPS